MEFVGLAGGYRLFDGITNHTNSDYYYKLFRPISIFFFDYETIIIFIKIDLMYMHIYGALFHKLQKFLFIYKLKIQYVILSKKNRQTCWHRLFLVWRQLDAYC